MHDDVSGGLLMSDLSVDRSPAVSFSFPLSSLNVCNNTHIMMNIIILHQQEALVNSNLICKEIKAQVYETSQLRTKEIPGRRRFSLGVIIGILR